MGKASKPDFNPEAFGGLSPTAKLVWFFIREHPGYWGRHSLAAALGIADKAVYAAIKGLLSKGLLEEVERGVGSRGAKYRVRGPEEK